ncbi:MAG TPA: class I mannose-6-phosphate isomerase [Pseudonocardiaceae bacterium]|jgi:mannose-6-phosphate isomerase|nr:class I mannose-6-phosphate isomerase [Pseudonocardiaceae bacterium]
MNSSPTTDNSVAARPVVLPANQPRQFYQGGKAIAALRGASSAAEYGPEDWVASTTPRFGKDTDGLSLLPDGRFLRDAVVAAPEEWLGAEHVATFGVSTALLVKLLDAGQRLPVHAHPSNAFAQAHFGSHFGKTEAWAVVGTSGAEPTVHIGFRKDIEPDTLTDWVNVQDREAMLGSLNTVTVSAGDTVLIPAGLPHSIGAGVFVVELQQPTDFSITLEWTGFLDDAKAGHLGIGFDTALGAVDSSGWDADRLSTIIRHTSDNSDPVVPLFNSGADPFFRADRLQVKAPVDLDPSFAVLVALEGSGRLRTEHGGVLELRKGDTAVVPHAAGSSTVDGELIMVRCRPPAADSQGDS